jgi:uncharacterized protein YbjT (DUF2867 family)
VEIVDCDLSTEVNLLPIFADAQGAFLVTDYWDPSIHNKEREIGIRLVNACKDAGVRNIVFSSLPNVEQISGGRLKVPHFTQKAQVEDYINHLQNQTPKAFATTTIVRAAFYYQNLRKLFPPVLENGILVFKLPEHKRLIAFDVNDLGPVVAPIFEYPELYNGRQIDVGAAEMTPDEMFDTMAKVLKRKVLLRLIPQGEARKENEEIAEMFSWFDEYGFFGPGGNITSGKKIHPNMTSFADWLQQEKDHFMVE